mmetsp:Transcript_25445/g.40747  ORF Transcript_25445/g.40747 Transcript_25445/m.40747 type:complete len:625 (-) Transcript_25445:70-1944(-)
MAPTVLRHRRPRCVQLLAGASCCLLGAFLNRSVEDVPRSRESAFALATRPAISSRPTHSQLSSLLSAEEPKHRSLGRRLVSLGAKGFGSEPAAPGGEDVPEPAGGWPTVSVLVLSSVGKATNPETLKQLAAQDYPLARIKEVIVSGADGLRSSAPEALRSLLRDFQPTTDDTLNLSQEFTACSGDMVAIWSDDHVSAPHRLRAQVSKAVGDEEVTLLQPTWFFDPMSQSFQKVREWPSDMLEDLADSGLPETLIKLFVCADLLTLCGNRQVLATAAADVRPDALPIEELKELVQNLPKHHLIEDLRWAAVRSPPAMTRYESARPDGALMQLAAAAWPKGAKSSSQFSLEAVLKEIQSAKMTPAAAIDAVLTEAQKLPQAPPEAELKRVGKVLAESLLKGGARAVLPAVLELQTWEGIAIGKGDVRAARMFSVFYEVFKAVRKYCLDNADFFEWEVLGPVAEGLVILGKKLWASDERVNEQLAMTLNKELYQQGFDKGGEKVAATDIMGTLGLRPVLQNFAFAALDLPSREVPMSALSAFAWALGEAEVANASLQLKVAKDVINNIDKVMPPDIGKLFVAMHERTWFKNEKDIAYLTQSLMKRIQDLKAQDPGIAKMLAEAQANR